MGSHRPADLLRATGRGMRGRASTRLGRAPTMMPLVGRPGEPGALTLPGAWEDYHSIAGPTWRNEIAADVTLELGSRKAAKAAADRSEGRRVGKEGVSTCRSRGEPYH